MGGYGLCTDAQVHSQAFTESVIIHVTFWNLGVRYMTS